MALVLAWEERVPSKQLKSNTSHTPHVNGCCVLSAKYDLRSSVISRLDVGVDGFVGEARRSKVNDLDSASFSLPQ